MKGTWLPYSARLAVSLGSGGRATGGGHAPRRAGSSGALSAVLLLVLAASAGLQSAGARVSAVSAPLARLPLCFEVNHGQAGPEAQFVARTRSGTFLLGPTEATVILRTPATEPMGPCARSDERPRSRRVETLTISLQFLGANHGAAMTGQGMLSGKVNYFLGSGPADWRTERPLFEKVCVTALYPGVDLVYYGNEQKLEYDFVVAPGADVNALCLRVVGADKLELDAQGDLVLSLGGVQLRQHKPIIHQVIGGVRQQVTGGYRLKDRQTVAFQVGKHDPQWSLTIDPVLTCATYLGGAGRETGRDIAVDGAGNVYVAGETLSAQLPTTFGVLQTNYAGGYPGAGGDAFVAKFDNSCSNLLYLTYLGGSGDEDAFAVAVDAAGCAYLTGLTDSRDFPTNSPIRPAITGTPSPVYGLLPVDGFVTKVNPTGSALLYSTYLGGDTYDEGLDIAVDSAGCAYVTGFTDSTNFPLAHWLQPTNAGSADAFISKLSPDGAYFVYSTYLGGTNWDQGNGIAIDALGRAWVTGVTMSTNFPTVNPIQSLLGGGQDVFVSVLAWDGKDLSLVRSTYLGGVADDDGYRIALDPTGNASVVGSGNSSWYPGGSFPITPGNLNPGGVFTSTDAGRSWSWVSDGLFHPQVGSLAVNPVLAERVYAGTGRGVARSSNAGATWETALQAQPTAYGLAPPISIGYILALAVDPLRTSRLYAGTYEGVYATADGGTYWYWASWGLWNSSSEIPPVRAIAVDPVATSTLYAGTSAGVFSSTNAALTWVVANNGLQSLDVRTLAIDPRTPAILYAATAEGVYRSTNQGRLWGAFNNGLTTRSCLSLAIDPQTPSTLYVGTTKGLFRTLNRGTNWSALPFNMGFTNALQVQALALDPSAPTTVYAGTTNGLFRSTDSGETWSGINTGLSVERITALAVSPANPSRLYAGAAPYPPSSTSDAFLTKLGASAGPPVSSVVLSGNGNSQGWDIAVDAAGNSYVVGNTTATNFSTAGTSGSLSATNHGNNDVFLTVINPSASALLYSVYLGGRSDDFGCGIAVDPMGNAYIVGQTYSTDFPTNAAFQPTLAGGADAFLAKIQATAPTLLAARQSSNIQLRWSSFAGEYSLERAASLVGPAAVWTVVTQAPRVVSNGWTTVTVPAEGARSFFRLQRY